VSQQPSPTEVYQGLKALAAEMPDFMGPGGGSDDTLMWIGRARVLLKAVCDIPQMAAFQVAAGSLRGSLRYDSAQTIRTIFFQGLAAAEALAPVGARGAFIAVNAAVDAYLSVHKVLETAKQSVLIVDPYLDAKVTDFARAVAERVSVRLLTSDKRVGADLAPALARWPAQFATRPLEARTLPARSLHDRVIIIDGRNAWMVSQSFKDLAVKSPAVIQRLDPEAGEMKIAFYEDAWAQAAPLA
jgi:hypothetical protein